MNSVRESELSKGKEQGSRKDNVARLGEGARLAESEEHHSNVSKGKNILMQVVYQQ